MKGPCDKPHEDVRVQRATPLRFYLAPEGQHWPKDAWSCRRASNSICAPFARVSPSRLTPIVKALWTDAQHVQEEETHHQLEDNCFWLTGSRARRHITSLYFGKSPVVSWGTSELTV